MKVTFLFNKEDIDKLVRREVTSIQAITQLHNYSSFMLKEENSVKILELVIDKTPKLFSDTLFQILLDDPEMNLCTVRYTNKKGIVCNNYNARIIESDDGKRICFIIKFI